MELEGMIGPVTVVTGFEKGSGKTTFLNLALPVARRRGPVALFTIGMDGAQKAREGQGGTPEIRVEPGDLVITTEALARSSTARFEILEALPGRTALGRLLLGRAQRGGSLTLVGPEHFSTLVEAVELVQREHLAAAVLVDGAVNRLTQVSAFGDPGFVFTARVSPSNLDKVTLRLRALQALSALPLEPEPEGHRIEGPLSQGVLDSLPAGVQDLSLEDLTRNFLDPEVCLRLLDRMKVTVRRRLALRGLAITLRDLSREAFLDRLGPAAAPLVCFNPCEVPA